MKATTRFGLYTIAGAALTGLLFIAPTLWEMTRGDAEAGSLVAARFVGAILGYVAAAALWRLKGERSRGMALAVGSILTNCWIFFVSVWAGLLGRAEPYYWAAPTAVFALAIVAFVLFNLRPEQSSGITRRPLEPLLRRTPINNLATSIN